jgi:hypothetical protein
VLPPYIGFILSLTIFTHQLIMEGIEEGRACCHLESTKAKLKRNGRAYTATSGPAPRTGDGRASTGLMVFVCGVSNMDRTTQSRGPFMDERG